MNICRKGGREGKIKVAEVREPEGAKVTSHTNVYGISNLRGC